MLICVFYFIKNNLYIYYIVEKYVPSVVRICMDGMQSIIDIKTNYKLMKNDVI